MKEKILQMVDAYWKFDDQQQPISSWHDKQDLLMALEKLLKSANMESKTKPDWLETLFNVNPSLAERAEKHIKGLYSVEDMEQFAEWCSAEGFVLSEHETWKNVFNPKINEHTRFATSQLREQWETETGRRVK